MEIQTDFRVQAILEIVARLVSESYLVGGAIRDHLMGRTLAADVDLAVNADGFDVARGVADLSRERVTFVPLDRESGTARLVLRCEGSPTVDISTLKGADIGEDLRNRDFTINAIAVSVKELLESATPHLIDPTGGRADIERKLVRICSPWAFRDDPLRIIRAFRFKAVLGFDITLETLDLVPQFLEGLEQTAPERIRDELFAILSSNAAFPALQEMEAWGLMDLLFPELVPMKGCSQNEYHHLDVWNHSLDTVRRLEQLLKDLPGGFGDLAEIVGSFAKQEPVKGRSLGGLLKLAALFHDSGKPATRTIDANGRVRFFGHEKVSRRLFEERALALKLANREISSAGEWIAGHLRPTILTSRSASRRAIYRLYRKFRTDVIGLFVLYLADLGASRGPARGRDEDEEALRAVNSALQTYLDYEAAPKESLINGRDVMSMFGLAPGPYLGSILKRIAELQGMGEITTREQAVDAAREFLARNRRASKKM